MTTPENDRQGIQADKPLEPWEQPGAFRRDCESHRGSLLGWAAKTSMTLAILSCCLFGLPALVAFPLSLATWHLACRDLVRIRKGLMDPNGGDLTLEARDMSLLACGLCCLIVAFVLLLLAVLNG